MPRKYTPGPKSRTQKRLANEPTEEESNNSESFGEPELEGDYTDYHLEYSSASPIASRRTHTPKTIQLSQRESEASTSRSNVALAAQTSTRNQNPPAANKKKRKQQTPLRREQQMWKLIRELQNRTDNLTPKLAFGRIIRELLMQFSSQAQRITATALEAIQISAELYITQLLSDAYVCTLHRGRVTLSVNDVRLVRFLRGPIDPRNV